MVKDAEVNAEADKKRKELAENKNQAETLIHTTEKTLSENADKVEAELKSQIEADIAALKEAITKENADDIKAKTEALTQSAMKLGELMNQQAPGAQAAAETSDSAEKSEDSSKDEKVVDA